MRGSALALLLLTTACLAVAADQGSPVVFRGDTLFEIRAGLGPFTPAQRAEGVGERLAVLSRKPQAARDTFRLEEDGSKVNIYVDSLMVMTITGDDTAGSGLSPVGLARKHAEAVMASLARTRSFSALRELLVGLGLSLLALVTAAGALLLMAWMFPKLNGLIRKRVEERFKGLHVGKARLISPSAAKVILLSLAQGIRAMLTLVIPYFGIVIILQALPWTRGWQAKPLLTSIVTALVITAAALALARLVNYVHRFLGRRLSGWKGSLIRPIRFKKVNILSDDQIMGIMLFASRAIRLLLLFVLAYLYLTVLFSLFSFTRTWAASLWGYVINPLKGAGLALVAYIPKAFFITVAGAITYYLLKLARLVFLEIGRGTISLPNFHRDWAMPTYSIARFLIIVFAVIIIFPYLPGSDSPFFKGISLFLGVLLSLGSSSAVSNVVAGVVLTYMRPFVMGDRVKVGETLGDIMDKSLLVTRIRTIKNEDITIPNSMVLGAHIVNYSREAKERGLILHTTVTIGYDAPWRQVHQMLLSAAAAVEAVLKEPKPFILQIGLDDHFVSYQLNCYTDKPNRMASTYSEIHQNIQDEFTKAGVQIMSPHYMADPAAPKIPPISSLSQK